MQTSFTQQQLADPKIAHAENILRKCVHCGFCTATCPTYVLLGDELDSPRGRIMLIKDMLEGDKPATVDTAKHVDRCLSCLACATTCPSGVNYMHLIDQARVHVEKTYDRPLVDRILRNLLAFVMPRPSWFRVSLIAASVLKPFAQILPKQLGALLDVVPATLPRPSPDGQAGFYPASGHSKGRVGLLLGCVQSVLDPAINAATIRLLNRLGYDVKVSDQSQCCGSLTHHMGKEHAALASARASIDQWTDDKIDALIITLSGCGTTIKDYGHMMQHDLDYAAKAKAISAKTNDITEFLVGLDLPQNIKQSARITYHAPCSLQHGQKVKLPPLTLLKRAGFEVVEPADSHLCCGSAGTYSLLQPDISKELKQRKISNINLTTPDIIVTGNIGCMTQLQSGVAKPVLHTIELLDWAYGGPKPAKLTLQGLQRL